MTLFSNFIDYIGLLCPFHPQEEIPNACQYRQERHLHHFYLAKLVLFFEISMARAGANQSLSSGIKGLHWP